MDMLLFICNFIVYKVYIFLKGGNDVSKAIKDEFEKNVIDTSKPRNVPTEDAKLYQFIVNGTTIDVDACTMYFAKGRVNKYLSLIKEESISQTASLLSFWADVIMLNLITNEMLTSENPYQIEKILNPVKYFSPQKAVEFFRKEQEKVEQQRKAEQDNIKKQEESE